MKKNEKEVEVNYKKNNKEQGKIEEFFDVNKIINDLKLKDDLNLVFSVFLIIILGFFTAHFYVPSSLTIENIHSKNIDDFLNIHSLQLRFKYIIITFTLALAQLPLEYLDSAHFSIKRNTKTILTIFAIIFGFLYFFQSL